MFDFEKISEKYGVEIDCPDISTINSIWKISTDSIYAFVALWECEMEEVDHTFGVHDFGRAETIVYENWRLCFYIKNEYIKPKVNIFGGYPYHTWQYLNGWHAEARPLDYCHGWNVMGTLTCNPDSFPFHFDWTHQHDSKSAFILMRLWNGMEWKHIDEDDVMEYLDHPVCKNAKYRVAWIDEPRGIVQEEFDLGVKVLDHFDYVLTHDPKLIDLENALPWPFAASCLVDDTSNINPEKTKMVSLIFSLTPTQNENKGANGYQLRRKIVDKYKDTGKIDMYGKMINHIDKKEDGLLDYKFSLAVENHFGEEGNVGEYYFTEKLLDCFHTKTVPIYCGNPAWAKWFDPKGVLTFNTIEELDEILNNISDEMYDEMKDSIEFNYNMVTTKFASTNRFLLEEYPFLFD